MWVTDTNNGVSLTWPLDCASDVYSNQARRGQSGEDPNAGKGMDTGWAECCLVLDHFNLNTIPWADWLTSSQEEWRVGSQSLTRAGAKFETLKKPNNIATLIGSSSIVQLQTDTRDSRSSI